MYIMISFENYYVAREFLREHIQAILPQEEELKSMGKRSF